VPAELHRNVVVISQPRASNLRTLLGNAIIAYKKNAKSHLHSPQVDDIQHRQIFFSGLLKERINPLAALLLMLSIIMTSYILRHSFSNGNGKLGH
jgi:hypothetical protein